MHKFLSPSFWLQTLLSTFFTMVCIYFIKKAASTYQIPFVSDVAEGV